MCRFEVSRNLLDELKQVRLKLGKKMDGNKQRTNMGGYGSCRMKIFRTLFPSSKVQGVGFFLAQYLTRYEFSTFSHAGVERNATNFGRGWQAKIFGCMKYRLVP